MKGLLQQKSKVLILGLIFSETIFFAFLVTAFVLYHGRSKYGASPWHSLDPIKTGIYSVVLWASSGTMWISERAMRVGRMRRMKRFLEASIILGAIFLVGQGLEYHDLISHAITVRTDLFATTFFTATGFHGLHVFIGLIVLLIMRGLTAGNFGSEPYQKEGFEAASYYWHFVDAVWVGLYFTIYVWGTR